jgi:hypothetical protein
MPPTSLRDHLDLLAGDRVAVLLHVKLDAVVELHPGIGELPGKGQDHADLYCLLCLPPRGWQAVPRCQSTASSRAA